MEDSDFKRQTNFGKNYAILSLFEQSYDYELKDVSEEMRGQVNPESKALIEMIRLGGVNGNPAGIYDGRLVSQVWDKVVRGAVNYQFELKNFERKLTDMERLRKQLNLASLDEISLTYFGGTDRGDEIGIFLFDSFSRKGFEFEGRGIHSLEASELLYLLPEEVYPGKIAPSYLTLGRYLLDQEDTCFTEGIETKVVMFEELGKDSPIFERARKILVNSDYIFLTKEAEIIE